MRAAVILLVVGVMAGALAAAARGMEISFRDGKLWLDGEDVTQAVRSESVSSATSRVAASPLVRETLLERQRGFRRGERRMFPVAKSVFEVEHEVRAAADCQPIHEARGKRLQQHGPRRHAGCQEKDRGF